MDTRKYKFNLKRSKTNSKDLMLESIYPISVQLPEIWDLRDVMTPIRDQGEQGTCSAQAAAAIKEWQENLDVEFKEHMSPQFIYNLRENQDEDGMTPRNTMDVLYNIGIVSETDYPYLTFKHITKELKKKAYQYKIQGYAQINTVDSLKKALFANGPCYIAFPVYNPDKMNFWIPDYVGQEMLGGHAVCVVGYLKDCFIIRNSWSSEWGNLGYCFMPFTDWGFQWECWTTIDADSNSETLTEKADSYKCKNNWLCKLFKINK